MLILEMNKGDGRETIAFDRVGCVPRDYDVWMTQCES